MKKKIIIACTVLAVVAAASVLSINLLRKSPASASGQGNIPASSNPQKELAEAQGLIQKGEYLQARDLLRKLLIANVSGPDIEKIQPMLEDVQMKIIFSAIEVAGETVYRTVKEGDTLSMIADEYKTTPAMIKKQNGLKSDVIRVGMRLRIWTGRFSVMVDKSQNLLTLRSNGEVIKTYRVSTGKDNITPVGTFKVVNKLVNPSWTHEGKLYPAGDPANILGTRWMGFDIPGYGIHGTTQPESIGTQATAGCVRMLNNEVEELYDMLPVNTEVVVID